MTDCPELRQTVIDTTEPRVLAEFYRRLLGYLYRPGDEPPTEPEAADRSATGDESSRDDADWLVLTDTHGTRKLAFQKVDCLEPTTWPDTEVSMQMHLDLTVRNRVELENQRHRAETLGAQTLFDRTDDEDEPLYVLADPAGHPFCIFVA